MPHPDGRLAALIAQNPHLDPDELTSAFEQCSDPDTEVRPYLPAEQRAHDLIGAWLAHTGARHYRGDSHLPDQSDPTRTVFLQAAGVDRGLVDTDGQPLAVLPLEVLIELLEDLTMHLASLRGAPLDTHHGYVQHRLTVDAARRAHAGDA